MALTSQILFNNRMSDGGEAWARVQVTCDASYPTGGYSIPASLFGFNAFMRQPFIDSPTVAPAIIAADRNATANVAEINLSTGKLQLFAPSGAEVAAATNVSTFRVILEAFGH